MSGGDIVEYNPVILSFLLNYGGGSVPAVFLWSLVISGYRFIVK